MVTGLILALSMSAAGQCAGGRCPAPTTRFAPTYYAVPVKQWLPLSITHPGYEGFGSFDATGAFVVEQHRAVGETVSLPGLPLPVASKSASLPKLKPALVRCTLPKCDCGCVDGKACQCGN